MRKFGLIGKNIDYSFSESYFSKKFKDEGIRNVSYENLQRPGLINKIKDHRSMINALQKIKYDKFLSIEMKKDNIASIVKGIHFVKNNYILN